MFEDLAYRILDQAMSDRRAGRYRFSLFWAKILRWLRFSGAFEVEGLVFRDCGALEKALAVLQEGVSRAPSVWLLHHLLGSTYSDLGRYEEALACYSLAEKCPHVELDFLNYNRSLVLERQGKLDAALEICPEFSQDPDLETRILNHRLGLLFALSQMGRLQSEATAKLDSEHPADQIHLWLARSFESSDPRRAIEHAVLSLLAQRKQAEPWEILDRLLPLSPVRCYDLWFEGVAPMTEDGTPSFVITLVRVAASSESEALEFYREVQLEGLAGLTLMKTNNLGPFPPEKSGLVGKPVCISAKLSWWDRFKHRFKS